MISILIIKQLTIENIKKSPGLLVKVSKSRHAEKTYVRSKKSLLHIAHAVQVRAELPSTGIAR